MEPQENTTKRSKITFVIVLIITLLISLAFYAWYNREYQPLTDPRLEETLGENEQGPINEAFTVPEDAEAGTDEVLVYYVDIENKRNSKETIGCGDSIIPISVRTITEDKSDMELVEAALSILLREDSQFVGKGGLYNALYQSDLTLDRIEMNQGIVSVYLTGQIKLGGVCDNPRFEQQIQYTVKQFESVRRAEIFINNEPLDLSQR